MRFNGILIIAIALLSLLIGVTFGEMWVLPIEVHSTGFDIFEETLRIGCAPGCTDDYDSDFDTIRPPLPPSGPLGYIYFDEDPMIDGLLCDFRFDGDLTAMWRLIYSTSDVMGDSFWLSWDCDDLPEGDFQIILSDAGIPGDWSVAQDMGSINSTEVSWFFVNAYIKYTRPVSIKDNRTPPQSDLRIYPNPFNRECNIETPSGAKIEIYDVNGRSISRSSIEKFHENEGSMIYRWKPYEQMSSGIYTCIIRHNEKSIREALIYIK